MYYTSHYIVCIVVTGTRRVVIREATFEIVQWDSDTRRSIVLNSSSKCDREKHWEIILNNY